MDLLPIQKRRNVRRYPWNCGNTSVLQVYRLSCFGHAARRPDDERTKDQFLPTPPGKWRRRTGGQLKVTTIKADLEPLAELRAFGYARRRKDWVEVSRELSQDRRVWSTSVVNSIDDADTSTSKYARRTTKLRLGEASIPLPTWLRTGLTHPS